MKLEVQNGIVRGLPLALLVTFFVQGAAFVWWASARTRDQEFLQQRVTIVETDLAHTKDGQEQILQKLARIEERLYAQSALLERIDKEVARGK